MWPDQEGVMAPKDPMSCTNYMVEKTGLLRDRRAESRPGRESGKCSQRRYLN